jgi:hypothetical protein
MDYEKQAEDFLKATSTTFAAKFLRNGKHFADEITLKRGSRSYVFNFGQSLNDSGFYYTKGVQEIPIDRKLLEVKNLKTVLQKYDPSFHPSYQSDKIHYPKIPTAYNVLACLQKYDVGTFEDFCSEFGYDEDSKRAEKIYKDVANEYTQLCALFTEEEMSQLQEIN